MHFDTHMHTHTCTLQESCLQCSVTRSTPGGPGVQGGGLFGKLKEPFQQAWVSLRACEVDIGISSLGFSCGVHLVGRVGNSCLYHTKVSRLGLTVSVSVQRKESILLDYGCALSVKQQTCSVWHVSRWFVAEPLVWSVSRSCCVTALCFSPPPPPPQAPSRLPQLCDVEYFSQVQRRVFYPTATCHSINHTYEHRLHRVIWALTKDQRDKVQARYCNYNNTKIFRERDKCTGSEAQIKCR